MQRIGRYEVIDELGRGAMGVVYRARDTQIGRIVALKVILTANASEQDIERYKQRFRREAQAAGRLSHPGIVTIHDIAEDESGQPYLVMEYIEGRPLNLLLGPTAQVALDRLLDIGIQVAEALDYAHRGGIVHRDIKPPNILVTPEWKAKIADFGIARMEGTELTQEGTSVGTPSYMSPEQFRGGEIDGRSDIFSLGAVLYWMFTGEKPFPGETVTRISFQVAFEAPTPPSVTKPGLPKELDEILARCMAKNPAGRYASGAELAADLAAVREGQPLPARPAIPAGGRGSSPQAQAAPLAATAERTAQLEDTDPNAQTRVAISGTRIRTQPLEATTRRRLPPGLLVLSGVILVAAGAGVYWKLGRVPANTAVPASVAAPAASSQPSAAPGETAAGNKTAPGSAAPGAASGARPDARTAGAAPETGTPGTTGTSADAKGTPAAGSASAGETSAAAPSSAPPAERAEKPMAADATLEIACKHPFRQAVLEIFVDSKRILRSTLEGKRQPLTLGMTWGGKLEAKRKIPSGRHTITVRVKSEEELYQDETSVTETISAHAVRQLEITFGREGSGPNGGRKVHLDLY
jgi:serine/threonine-protein kinase